jgi:hypothetical protein
MISLRDQINDHFEEYAIQPNNDCSPVFLLCQF